MAWRFLLLLLLLPTVGAVDEADAPSVDPRIAEVGHEPEEVQPGQQWDGFIRFHPGHNVTDVAIKVCRVAVFCNIYGPLADRVDDNTWRFNTEGKVIGGGSVEWGINDAPDDDSSWRVGVQYLLLTEEMEYDLSDGLDGDELALAQPVPHAETCDVDAGREAWEACEESHYFAFTMPGRPVQEEQSPAPLLILPLLGALLLRRR